MKKRLTNAKKKVAKMETWYNDGTRRTKGEKKVNNNVKKTAFLETGRGKRWKKVSQNKTQTFYLFQLSFCLTLLCLFNSMC